jgi:hypothetical protein
MFRCRTDGSSCRERTLDPAKNFYAYHNASELSAAFDPVSRMLFVATPLITPNASALGVILFGL